MANNPQWNRETVLAPVPHYLHPMDDTLNIGPPQTIRASRETWHNAKAAIEMFEHRQILAVHERVWAPEGLPEGVIDHLKRYQTDSLRAKALEDGLLIFGPIKHTITGISIRTEAVVIRPFEWKGLY